MREPTNLHLLSPYLALGRGHDSEQDREGAQPTQAFAKRTLLALTRGILVQLPLEACGRGRGGAEAWGLLSPLGVQTGIVEDGKLTTPGSRGRAQQTLKSGPPEAILPASAGGPGGGRGGATLPPTPTPWPPPVPLGQGSLRLPVDTLRAEPAQA